MAGSARATASPGDPLQGDGEGKGSGQGEAGDSPGEHALEVEIELDELAQILGEELELPNIEPRGQERFESVKLKYAGIRPVGPDSLKHVRRTFKRALRRQIASGLYDPKRPDYRADSVRFRVPLVEGGDAAASQRGHHLHDGRLRLDG
jgi:uncharacterized sporulation protein YeaH/YhbH (DUF444 family)